MKSPDAGCRVSGIKPVAPHTPIQYIIGSTDFCGYQFSVDDRVLIPRPETELVVEKAVDIINSGQSATRRLRILDLCTGSGNIAISLARKLSSGLTKDVTDCTILASDISDGALEVSSVNARSNGLGDRISFVKSDLFKYIGGLFDIIVSNPPYIARDEFATLQEEVLKEPHIALDGGPDGLVFYRKILSALPSHLERQGALVMEIGYGQLRRIRAIVEGGQFRITEVLKDINGIDRVVVVRWIN